jgi:ABC-type branched-subunit amino acid transport system ATPase component
MARLEDMLQMFPNLAARAGTAAGVLSSGEKQRLTIWRTRSGRCYRLRKSSKAFTRK